MMKRRSFLQGVAAAATAAVVMQRPLFAAADKPEMEFERRLLSASTKPKIKLGMDNYAVRAMGWKAPALIDYAASIKLDSILISDLDAYESFDDAALREVRRRADAAGVAIYAGSWSICPTSVVFKKNWGTAEEHVRLGLRVAKALGSPVFRAVLGTMEDRKTPGGIRARMTDLLAVIKACRKDVEATGVKVALENHAGDMHSWELRELIDQAGTDFVGCNIDSGNAVWTLEDPMDVLENLGPVTICSSLRDDMVWETPDGATVQWTAAGEGLIDWKAYAARWSELCPSVPIMIETISGGQKVFPYKKPEFWQHYDKRPAALAKFEAMAKRGHALPPFKAPPGEAGKKATQEFQKAELEKSIAYLREKIGLGVRR